MTERSGQRWTDEENAALIALGDKDQDWDKAGLQLQRSRWSCKIQYHALKRGTATGIFKASNQRVIRQNATALAKEIRDTSPQHRTITAEFFGDPLPGRSALDQRRAMQAEAASRVPSLATGVQL